MAEPPNQKPAGRTGKLRQQATEATAAVVREKGTHPGEDVTMNGPLYKRKSANVVLVRRQRRKDEGAFRLLASLFVENQIGEFCFRLVSSLFTFVPVVSPGAPLAPPRAAVAEPKSTMPPPPTPLIPSE